ncbi:DEAD/DEAH box helicase domain containing protein [Acanthamoeba castellanii str. Neff]|uniref:ATP-dependent RNA helicase n=1 Tax=Acanthamoeba castellanii (strain ATCC 30010 / Neff) TaxID=1257118 RepID=L8GY19_ACACF|nr:DEAD/DEAH box helicase domain containing protein [Acanthamoeba castellanii str. Neff]ELR17847.1 DEAD/DEAH box helicase domain containing protein [Acanthamoeba castellanii str. Neff]
MHCALPAVLTGEDVVLGAETGSGKTLAYLLPVIHALSQQPPPRIEASNKYPSAIVLLPNKELCEQVLSVCKKVVPPILTVKAINGTELPAKRPDILLTTPNGLAKSLNDDMLHWVRHIIVDEADLMLSPVYHDQILDFFKRETRRERKGKGKVATSASAELADELYGDKNVSIVRKRKVQFIFVAATIPLQDKSKSLSIYLQKHFKHVRQVYTHHFHRSLPNVALSFLPLPEEVEDRVQTLVDLLRSKSGLRVGEPHLSSHAELPHHQQQPRQDDDATPRQAQAGERQAKESDDERLVAAEVADNGERNREMAKPRPTLIFVNSTLAVDDLHEELVRRGVTSIVPFHREMPQGEADRNLRDFLAGKVDVMVSTNLASRGIDFVDVEHVVQFHFAQSLVDHIHRVGRTGRGGRSGEVTCFYREADMSMVEAIRQAEEQNVQMAIQYKPTPEKYKLHKRRVRSPPAATANA